MAVQERINPINRAAGADLSAQIYRFMKLDSSGRAIVASVLGEHVVGVLQNNPAVVGQGATLAAVGSVTKVVAGGTVNPGNKVTTTAAGAAQLAASTHNVIGTCLDGGVSGDIITVLLDNEGVLA